MPHARPARYQKKRVSGHFPKHGGGCDFGTALALVSVVDPTRWRAWRERLGELKEMLDAHLDAADTLTARETEDTEPQLTTPHASTREVVDSPEPDLSPEVTRALAHLAANYERAVSVAELARVAGCSRDRLARAVRRETGVTIHAHLMRLRLARAAREVGNGDKIEAVMLGVGYRGKRNFYRQFKARFGMTPGRWREAARRGER